MCVCVCLCICLLRTVFIATNQSPKDLITKGLKYLAVSEYVCFMFKNNLYKFVRLQYVKIVFFCLWLAESVCALVLLFMY